MAEKLNRLIITAHTAEGRTTHAITLSNPQMTMAGWRWDGAALTHPGRGTPRLRFTPELTAAITAAVAECTPATSARAYGFELAPDRPDLAEWRFSHVEDDAHGVYYRDTPGVGKTVAFSGDDVTEGL